MRFYKITTNYNQDKINEVIMSMTSSEVDYVIKIYGQLSMVEYTDENGFECMFAILDNYLISAVENKFRGQEVELYLYLPKLDPSTGSG